MSLYDDPALLDELNRTPPSTPPPSTPSSTRPASARPSRQNSQASTDSSSCSSFEKISPDEAVQGDENALNLFANTLPPIVLAGNAIVDTPDPDPRTVPIKPSQEKYYTMEVQRTALANLVVYSLFMFTAPFAAMYISFHYVFLDYFNLPRQDAVLYSGFVAVVTTIAIMISFVLTAYREECASEREKLAEGGGKPEGEKKWGQGEEVEAEKETEEEEDDETKKDK